jgi:NADPH-dependent curcumin reductase
MNNQQIILKQRPQGMVKDEDFELVQTEISELQDGEVRVENKFISIDPAMRGWMNESTTYIKGVELGGVMRGFAAGYVVESKHSAFQKGDAVQGLTGVQQFAVSNGKNLNKVNAVNFPLSWHLGILGMPGWTAYFGLLDKGQPQAGETVLVSAAAGMIGSVVGQIAKLKGCTVIGIAGGDAKCKYVVDELGFDACIDYKKANVAEQLKEAAFSGVHVYFDNVGGEILDAAMLNLARGARVVICGSMSQYNDANFLGLKNYMKIVTARGALNGIIVFDYFPRAQEAIDDLGKWTKEGSIKYKEHIVDGLANFPAVLRMLFTGANYGKLLLKI